MKINFLGDFIGYLGWKIIGLESKEVSFRWGVFMEISKGSGWEYWNIVRIDKREFKG